MSFVCPGGINKNLLSLGQAAQSGMEFSFRKNSCLIKARGPQGIVSIYLEKIGNLYPVGVGMPPQPLALTTTTNAMTSTILWHHKFGHLNVPTLQRLHKENLVIGFNATLTNGDLPLCTRCLSRKQHRLSFPKFGAHRAHEVLDLIHSDLYSPMQTMSLGGARYFATFIDDFSRFTIVHFLRENHEVFSTFQNYKTYAETSIGCKIKCLRSDNGGEYLSNDFRNFCTMHGITRQNTNPYTPKQNGVAERKNFTLVESARSMVKHANLSNSFWGEAITIASYIKN